MRKPELLCALLAVVALAIPGCAVQERAVGPRRPELSSRPDVSPSGQPMIWDYYGRSYTLDVANQRITASTGEVIEMDANETAEAANAFTQTNQDAAGYLDNMLQSNPPPPDTLMDYARSTPLSPLTRNPQQRGADPRTAASAVSLEARASAALARARSGREQRRPTRDAKPRWLFREVSPHPASGRPGVWGITRSSTRVPSAAPGGASQTVPGVRAAFDITSIYGSLQQPSCLDIARQISDLTPGWRSARDAYLDALVKILPQVQVDPTTGELKVKLPEVQEAIDFDQAAYDLSQRTTQLNILAVFYGEYGCFSNTWPDASGTSGGSLSTASVSLQCHDETWQISTDGGATWSDIDVSVCEYQI